MLLRLCLAVLLVVPVVAQKKPVTVEAVTSLRPAEVVGNPVWRPGGKAFAYRERDRVMLYDCVAKSAKELLSMDTLTKAATTVPADPRFLWENRRVREEAVQWLPSVRRC
jgi:hypothetical protein